MSDLNNLPYDVSPEDRPQRRTDAANGVDLSKEQIPSSRHRLGYFGVASLAILGAGGAFIWSTQSKPQPDVWRSAGAPEFTLVTHPSKPSTPQTYQEVLEAQQRENKEKVEQFNNDRVLLRAAITNLAQAPESEEPKQAAKLLLEKLAATYDSASSASKQIAEREQRLLEAFESPQALADTLFEQVTGKKPPLEGRENLKNPSDFIRKHGHREDKTLLKSNSFISSLKTNLHIYGHLTSQVSGFGPQANIRREACAELFCMAAGEKVQDKTVRDAFGLNPFMLEQAFQEEPEYPVHAQAYALASAAIEHYGSAAAAFNILSQDGAYDPNIDKIIESYKARFLSTGGFKNGFQPALDVKRVARAEYERLKKLASQ